MARRAVPIALIALAAVASLLSPTAADTVDHRLDRKVTYQAEGALLRNVIQDLSKQTGVAMRSGSGPNNWQVRDRKVTVIVRDMPLREIQAGLASILHFTWTKFEGKSGRYYRLIQTAQQKKEEQALRDGSGLANPKKQQELTRAAIEQIEGIPSLSPDDITKLRKDNPWLYALAKHPVGKATADLLRLVPELRQALISQQQLSISLDDRNPDYAKTMGWYEGHENDPHFWKPEAFAAITRFVEASDDFLRKIEPFDADAPRKLELEGGNIEINTVHILPDGHPLANGVLGVLIIDANKGGFLPIYDPKSTLAKASGRIYADIVDGKPAQEAYGPDGGDTILMETVAESGEFGDLPKDDPDLAKKIKLDPQRLSHGMPFISAAESIATQADVQVISDHFEPDHALRELTPEDKLGPMLTSISLLAGKTVKKEGSLITFQERDWFVKRAWEVPQDMLDHLHKAAKEKTLDIDDYVSLVGLTDDQLIHTIRRDELLAGLAWGLEQSGGDRYILRLYGSLNAQQHELVTTNGLDVDSLSPSQSALLQTAESHWTDDDTDGSDILKTRPLMLALEVDDKGGHYNVCLMGHKPKSGEQQLLEPVMNWQFDFPRPEP